MKNPKERKYIFYENMPELKRMRLVVLSKANGICEKCGKPARLVHHRDGGRTDHSPENLVALCTRCHGCIHSEMRWFALSGLFFPNSLISGTSEKILRRMRTADMRKKAKDFRDNRASAWAKARRAS